MAGEDVVSVQGASEELPLLPYGGMDLKTFLGQIEWEDKTSDFEAFVLRIFHANGIKARLRFVMKSGCGDCYVLHAGAFAFEAGEESR
jgi:hypothetical protein